MAFSQKYEGKVLVPWYNSSEWKYVYEILYNKNESKYFKALEILKIWKLRTPLLSAGIEGTLIILDAMLQNKESLSEDQIVQIYSVSLLRFLNLTAGNADKQGYFNKTVKKNDLPKWLIDIRHDIAHNNKLPSRAILELSFNQCLKWTVEKYWNVQNETICDYFVTQNPEDIKVTELLEIYSQFNVSLHYKRDMNSFNEALLKKINYLVMKRHNKASTDFHGVLVILEEMLKQSMDSVDVKNSATDIINVLINEKSLFAFIIEENIEDFENIPVTFKQIWFNVLKMLIENGFLSILLKKLHEITNDFLTNNTFKKASALWLKEIIQDLYILKVGDYEKHIFSNNTIKDFFSSLVKGNHLDLNYNKINFNSKEYEKLVLSSPNIYTLEYILFLLYYNDHSDSEVEEIIKLVKSMISESYKDWEGEYLDNAEQVEDLFENDIEMQLEELSVSQNNEETVQNNKLRSKWRVVTNKSDYEGCPLGVLPHQDRSKNPCINFI